MGAARTIFTGDINRQPISHVAHPDLPAEERAAGAEELIAVIRRYAK
jgi:hypothetical protein